jgi:Uma2 family endonuclease
MSVRTTAPAREWTVADLVRRFGAIPVGRIRLDPPPGTATEDDVVAIHDHEGRLYELIDGVLVEKAMGFRESYIATLISHHLCNYVAGRNLGIVVGADAMVRLAPGLVRIPDVSFVSWARLPGRRIPEDPIAGLAPDLAVEVLSRGNTKKEMEGKLLEYFGAGVRLVWYVDPAKRTVRTYIAPDQPILLREDQTLDGGAVLPGISVPVRTLFAEPEPPADHGPAAG